MKTIFFLICLMTTDLKAEILTDESMGELTEGSLPYDKHFKIIRLVLKQEIADGNPNFEKVKALMVRGKGFADKHELPFRPRLPSEVENRKSGDCKDKALWLAWRMQSVNVIYVVGKQSRHDTSLHAWLLWRYRDRVHVLDCMFYDYPFLVSEKVEGSYIPYYGYTATGKIIYPEGKRQFAFLDRVVNTP